MRTDEIFSLRNNFTIIGLTGKMGSGCTHFANRIANVIDFNDTKIIRKPEQVPILKGNNLIFKRKYTICYNYFSKVNSRYKKISYKDVLLFYTLHYLTNQTQGSKENLIIKFHELTQENFKKSVHAGDNDYHNVLISIDEINNLGDYDNLIKTLTNIPPNLEGIKNDDEYGALYDSFFLGHFPDFSASFYQLLAQKDYYLGTGFVHRLGNKIRATGNPTSDYEHLVNDPSHIHDIVKLIKKLIKSWKQKNETCHICIDSLRNSLEVMFLKERFSAFYMIAIHNENRHEERIFERVKELQSPANPNEPKITVTKILNIDKVEGDIQDFKRGVFYAPDVDNCIQMSDIHINNPGEDFETENNTVRDGSFYSMIEQWIKIKALISHPGLITPSHEERCMQMAYTAKLNSGCISRQVGAVITDKNSSIKSVGWNDVPKGQVPCLLKDLNFVINPKEIDENDKSYSDLEIGKSSTYRDNKTFSEKTIETLSHQLPKVIGEGLNYSYCFKKLHNTYELKDNQVHTRSLHAEENSMLQISKFGGQPLENGTLYTTASPCELCAKKAYQLGISKIIYIDPYPGITNDHVLNNGYAIPDMKLFTGVIGRAYMKLFEPILPFKDEISLVLDEKECPDTFTSLLELELNQKLPPEINKAMIIKKIQEYLNQPLN